MLDQTYNLPQSAQEILGDLSALAEQLGGTASLDALCAGGSVSDARRITSAAGLASFFNQYASAALIAHELPAIVRAHAHATRGQTRELIVLDEELTRIPELQPFARASWAVGRTQLRRLRPLRGERVIQRYFEAVESGKARAWHTLVFGIVLGVYSLPLRQGLAHFSQRTLGGFIEAARDRFTISESERTQLLDGASAGLQPGLEKALSAQWPSLQLTDRLG